MPTLQLRRTSLFWFQGVWELGRVFDGELFCFCLFVCLFFNSWVLRWVINLFFKSHKWVRFSCSCFVLFFLQNVQFPHHNLGSGWFFLSRRLIKFFTFFYFCLFVCLFVCLYFILFYFIYLFIFCFCFQKFHPPLISNGAPLSLFYYTDDGGHYVIDNFEFPCNSVKNLIPIWNFTNISFKNVK